MLFWNAAWAAALFASTAVGSTGRRNNPNMNRSAEDKANVGGAVSDSVAVIHSNVALMTPTVFIRKLRLTGKGRPDRFVGWHMAAKSRAKQKKGSKNIETIKRNNVSANLQWAAMGAVFILVVIAVFVFG